jgi:butyrate kinase
MARAKFFVDLIAERIKFIAPIRLYPGEDEIKMLAEGVCRILKNEEKAKVY